MHQLIPDNLFEILARVRWEDVAPLCRSNVQFAQICKSERRTGINSSKTSRISN